MAKKQKKARLILTVIILWVILICYITLPWMHQFDRADLKLSIMAHLSALIWWMVLLWAFHHLTFQIISLFRKNESYPKLNLEKPSVAILYVTCNDFNRESCLSCINQEYSNKRVFICDDSNDADYIRQIDDFYAKHNNECILVRRNNNQGYKAGNLNNVIDKFVTEEWILLVDADQVLRRFNDSSNSYLSNLIQRLPKDISDIAFVQAAHEALLNKNSTLFERIMSPEVYLYYGRDMSARETYGFVPMLGHGALIRISSWEKFGGFPKIVSEDFGFALRASLYNQHGIYIEDVISQEAIPKHFNAFMIRLKKFAAGTAELFRKEIFRFLFGPASLIEKWDFLVSLSWYIIMPLVTINGFLAAYVVHELWSNKIPYLNAIYPYLYIGLILLILAIHISVAQEFGKTMRFYFWSTAIYSSSMPIAGLRFIKHLSPKFPAVFDRTPKCEGEDKINLFDSIFMLLLGISAIVISFVLISPFSPFLTGQGVAYASFPLYGKLSSNSVMGKIAGILIYVPGLFMLFAIYTMWVWGRF